MPQPPDQIRHLRTAALLLGSMLFASPLALAATHIATHKPAARLSDSLPKGPPLTPEEQTAQVLSRFSFGPRPGELVQVTREGLGGMV